MLANMITHENLFWSRVGELITVYCLLGQYLPWRISLPVGAWRSGTRVAARTEDSHVSGETNYRRCLGRRGRSQARKTRRLNVEAPRQISMSCCMYEPRETALSLGDCTHQLLDRGFQQSLPWFRMDLTTTV